MTLKPESYVVEVKGEFLIWCTEGDIHPYWVSDEDGTEIISFETLDEAREHITQGAIYDND